MPAKSKAQQKAAGAALSAKRGDTPKAKLKGASRDMSASMSADQLAELASTDGKPLPARKVARRIPSRKAAKKAARKVARRAPAKTDSPKKATRKTPARKAPMTRQDKKRAANRLHLRNRAAAKKKKS